jgi:hypothetical protein
MWSFKRRSLASHAGSRLVGRIESLALLVQQTGRTD